MNDRRLIGFPPTQFVIMPGLLVEFERGIDQ